MFYKKPIPYHTLAPKVEQVLFRLLFFTKFPRLSHPQMLGTASTLSLPYYLNYWLSHLNLASVMEDDRCLGRVE